MTSARRTPRYVGIIGAEPIGPQLMGPHPMAAPAEAPQPAVVPSATPARRSGSGILPLHREQPGRYLPQSDRTPTPPLGMPRLVVEEPAAPAAPAAPPAKRRHVVPVERRPWRVMIVSAAPSAAPRTFDVARWQARTALALLALLAALASAFVASVVVAVRSPDLFVDGTEVQEMRSELSAMRDSLALSRAALAESESDDGSGDGDSAAGAVPAPIPEASAIPVPAKPHAAADRPKPFAARAHEARESHVLALVPRSFADLPVIGALASGFSLARRHPLLHRIRPHLGVDLAAPRGTRVSAPAPGRVSFVGRKLGFGLVVELDHGDGITTRYAHLRSSAVETGEQVTKGEAIAAVGTSGITTGPHLHYEVLVHGHQVDPLRFRFAQPDAPAGVVSAGSPAAPSPAPLTGAGAVPAVHDGVPSPPSPQPR